MKDYIVTVEELKDNIYNDLLNNSSDDSMISVKKVMVIIDERLDECFNQILPGEEEYYD